MKKIILSAILLTIMLSCQSQVESQQLSNNQNKIEKKAIEKLLSSYFVALNASDVNKMSQLFTQSGVVMAPSAPTSIGQEQIKRGLEMGLKNIELNLELLIDEIIVSGDYAFLRSTSKGTVLIRATGETVPSENRELFVLQKENGSWKIARYMFQRMGKPKSAHN